MSGLLRPLQRQAARRVGQRASSSSGQAPRRARTTTPPSTNYQKAYAKAPKDLRYRTALYRVRVSASSLHVTKGRKLFQAGDEQGALVEFLHAAEIDPGNEAAQQEIARVRAKQGQAARIAETSLPESDGKQQELDSMGAPAELKPVSNEPLTLHMTEDAKVIYQAIGKAAGVNVLFDPDYTSKRIQVDLNNVSLLDALRIVGTMSNTFWRPVTANTIFVAQNTRAKRTELDEQAVQTFYLTNAWQQNDLNDVQTALRNVLPNAKVYGVASQNAIVMRGTPDELLLAQKLINDLDKARARSGGGHRRPRGQQELGEEHSASPGPAAWALRCRPTPPAVLQPAPPAPRRPPRLRRPLSTIWPISRRPILRSPSARPPRTCC